MTSVSAITPQISGPSGSLFAFSTYSKRISIFRLVPICFILFGKKILKECYVGISIISLYSVTKKEASEIFSFKQLPSVDDSEA